MGIKYNTLAFLSPTIKKEALQLFDSLDIGGNMFYTNFTKVIISRQEITGQT